MDITATLLDWMISYGAPMFCLILFLSALGTPIPGTVVVVAAGAFIRQDLLSIYTVPLLGLLGSVTGDSVIFGVGRFASERIERRFGTKPSWINAKKSIAHRGGIAIYLSHWFVPLLAVPTNLVAGSSRYQYPKLLVFDLAGRITWVLIYGGLGYIFGAQWELITEFMSNFSGLIIGVLAVGLGIYLIVRYFRQQPSVVA
jgi:membrane-associated protein